MEEPPSTPTLRQLGGMLKETPRNKGVKLNGRDNFGSTKLEPPKDIPTLRDLGIDKKTSSIAQQVASLTGFKVRVLK